MGFNSAFKGLIEDNFSMLEMACKMVHNTDRLKLSVHQISDITVIT